MPNDPIPYTRNSLFRGIPEDTLNAQHILGEEVALEPGDIVFDEGDPPDFCYLIGSGAIHITKALPDGRQ